MSKKNILTDQAINFAVKVLDLKKTLLEETAFALMTELESCAYEIGENVAVTAIDELSEEALQAALSATLRAEYWIKLLIATAQIPEDEKTRELSFDCLDIKCLVSYHPTLSLSQGRYYQFGSKGRLCIGRRWCYHLGEHPW